MNIENIQALIAQRRVVNLADLKLDQTYVQLGVFQEGNRKSGGPGANSYAPYAISLAELGSGGGSSTLVIDGNESNYYKYADLFDIFTSNIPLKNVIIKNIEGSSNILLSQYDNIIENLIIENCSNVFSIIARGMYLKNITITNSPATYLYVTSPQLESLTIPSGLIELSVSGVYSNNQSFGLSTAPDLTPSESTLTYIEFYQTNIQFTDANYFQITNKANITYLALDDNKQLNNTLPLGLLDNLIGLNFWLSLYRMDLIDIAAGMFSFLEAGNIGLSIHLEDNNLTEQSIDNVITDCLDRATNNGAINITLNISGGTNSTPSAQALLDIATLTGTYGWTINYNP